MASKKGLEAGERVRVEKDGKAYEGVVLPASEYAGANDLVLKLDNGYNIGVSVDGKSKITLLGKRTRVGKAVVKKEYSHSTGLPEIAVLSTGGTIASRIDYETGGVKAEFSASDIVASAPELKEIANIDSELIFNLMSEDLLMSDWKKIASHVAAQVRKGKKGVIITHGTNTMHYSSAALSFALRNLGIPVVFTGAQRSSDRGSSDAFVNLVCSAKAAVSEIAEVQLCMHGSISDDYCFSHRGTKVRKMHTSRRDAFQSINASPLARIHARGGIEFLTEEYNKRGSPGEKLKVVDDFEERTALIYTYPNMRPDVLDWHVEQGYKGLVLMGTGLGEVVPTKTKYSLIPSIKAAVKKGVPVVVASKTIHGRVHPFVYANLRTLFIDSGAIPAQDMTPETAFVKLAWVLPQAKGVEHVRELMMESVAGEISPQTPVL